jgi:hypothetical protein
MLPIYLLCSTGCLRNPVGEAELLEEGCVHERKSAESAQWEPVAGEYLRAPGIWHRFEQEVSLAEALRI